MDLSWSMAGEKSVMFPKKSYGENLSIKYLKIIK